jgi:type IV pilus assembly protein PilM
MGQHKTRGISHRVGLDIGSHSITAVEVIERGSETVIRSAGSAAIAGVRDKNASPDAASVVHAIKSLWSSAAFQTKKAVVALPPASVYVKWLHLEAPGEEELANTARNAAARGAPFPATDAIVDYRVLSTRGVSARNVHFVMLVAASATAVDELLNIAETAGLEPLGVDVGAVAVARSFELQKRSASPLWSGQPQAHCQIGANSTLITVMRGGELEFARTVPVGGNDFTQCIADSAGLPWAEAERIKLTPGVRLTSDGALLASRDGEQLQVSCDSAVGRLAREMHRSLKFFRSQFAEGSYLGMTGVATLSGGGALLRGIDACLENQGIEVASIINPFAGFSVAAEGKGISHVVDSAAQYTTALGLALADYWSDAGEQRLAA